MADAKAGDGNALDEAIDIDRFLAEPLRADDGNSAARNKEADDQEVHGSCLR